MREVRGIGGQRDLVKDHNYFSVHTITIIYYNHFSAWGMSVKYIYDMT